MGWPYDCFRANHNNSHWSASWEYCFNTERPRQNGRHFPDDNCKRIFFNENVWISIKISLKFVSKGPVNNIPALVQIMAWRRPGDKGLSKPVMVSLLTHICVTRSQWVNCTTFTYHAVNHSSVLSCKNQSLWYRRLFLIIVLVYKIACCQES